MIKDVTQEGKDKDGNHIRDTHPGYKRRKVIKKIRLEKKMLTPEQKEEINNAFVIFDKDKSGSIDIGELKDAMKALGVFQKKQEIKETMQRVDKDGSGNIDIDEFTALMAEFIGGRNQKKEMIKVFRIFDDGEDKIISKENLAKSAADQNVNVTDEELDMMIMMADKHDLGGVNEEDFMALMMEFGLYKEEEEDEAEAAKGNNVEDEVAQAEIRIFDKFSGAFGGIVKSKDKV